MGASAKNARVSRAKANLAAAENRRNYTGKNLARSKRTARKALEFMSNPRSAIQNRSLGLGFRMPKTGRPKSTTKAAAKPAKAAAKPAPKVDVNSFNAMKRRYDRTKFENSGLTFNTSDRPKGTKQLVTGINRKRAFGIYRAQAARPLNELTQQVARAPFGKFSTVKNPAPAKAFPSQAPGRTKAAEAKAREYRKAAKRPKKK